MYKVYLDDRVIYDTNDDDLALTSPTVNLQDNAAGSFSFTMPPTHPCYNDIQKLKSVITVHQDDAEIFCGRVTEESKDFYNCKTVYCEGELNYLLDSVQCPAEYHNKTVRGFLETLIENHNTQVEPEKQFTVGAVTVTDPNDSLYRYTNYENTLTCITQKLIEKLGGHLVIRKDDGTRYIDYLADYPVTSDQIIEFGTNLLDYSANIDVGDIATAIIPLGAKLDKSSIAALEERLTIKSVNNDSDVLYNADAVDAFGWITKVVTFDDVTVPSNLLSKGKKYLQETQYENLTLNVTAVDLHAVNADIDKIGMLNLVRVKSKPHGIDKFFPVTEMEIHLDAPENNSLQLGANIAKSFTTSVTAKNTTISSKIETLPTKSSVLTEAVENATALIKNGVEGGHVLTSENEMLIMDTNDKDTANKVWRWNVNGLGYSNTGYNGSYGLAMTMDGKINADMITTGTLNADRVRSGVLKSTSTNPTKFDLTTGEIISATADAKKEVKIADGGITITVDGDTFDLVGIDINGKPQLYAKRLNVDDAIYLGSIDNKLMIIGGGAGQISIYENGVAKLSLSTSGIYTDRITSATYGDTITINGNVNITGELSINGNKVNLS